MGLLEFNGHIDDHVLHDGGSERSHRRVRQLYLELLSAADLFLRSVTHLIRLRLRQSCALVSLFGHVEGHICFLGEMSSRLMLGIHNSQDFVELLPLVPQHVQILFIWCHVGIVAASDHSMVVILVLGSVINDHFPDLLRRILFKVSFLTVTTWERFHEFGLLHFELLSSFIFSLPVLPFWKFCVLGRRISKIVSLLFAVILGSVLNR